MSNSDPMYRLMKMVEARYPCIYVQTHEEMRFVTKLRTAIEAHPKMKFNIMEWTSTYGLRPNSAHKADKKTCDVNHMLNTIDEEKEQSTIYILKSLGVKMKEAQVQRRMKDIISNFSFKLGNRTVIKIMIVVDASLPLVNGAYKIPVSLEKDVVVYDFPLMNAEEVRSYLDDEYLGTRPPKGVKKGEWEDQKKQIVQASLSMSQQEIDNSWGLSFVMNKEIKPQVIYQEKKNLLRKSNGIKYYEPKFGLERVGGLERLKGWIKEVGIYWTPEGRSMNLPLLKGVLLVGVTGTGKSMTAKTIGAAWNLPVLFFDMGALFSSGVGDSERNARMAVQILDAAAPCIAVFDELEKSASGYRSSAQSDAGTTNRVIATLLTWMEEHTSEVFVVGTCNDIRLMPPELVGRFDERFFCGHPEAVARKEIFSIHISEMGKIPLETVKKDWKLSSLVKASKDRTGREIEQAVKAGIYKAAVAQEPLQEKHVLSALNEKISIAETMKEEINALYHWVGWGERPDGKKDGIRARFASVEDEKSVETKVEESNVVSFDKANGEA